MNKCITLCHKKIFIETQDFSSQAFGDFFAKFAAKSVFCMLAFTTLLSFYCNYFATLKIGISIIVDKFTISCAGPFLLFASKVQSHSKQNKSWDCLCTLLLYFSAESTECNVKKATYVHSTSVASKTKFYNHIFSSYTATIGNRI